MFDFHRDPGDESDPVRKVVHIAGPRPNDDLYIPHPGLSDALNAAIAESQLQGGAKVRDLPVGKGYKVTTKSCEYTIRRVANADNSSHLTIQGHPKFCPTPTQCNIHGSTWGGSAIKIGFIGRGMHLEVGLPTGVMTTTEVCEVEEIA